MSLNISRRAFFSGTAVSMVALPYQESFAQSATDLELLQSFSSFWSAPVIGKVPEMMMAWERSPASDNPGGKISAMGFLGGLFEKTPAAIDVFGKDNTGVKTKPVILMALRLADRGDQSERVARLWDMRPIAAPKFADIKVADPATFDMMWGASFATGDGRYARRIWDFLASIARDEAYDIRDIQLLTTRSRSDQNTMRALAEKYGKDKFRHVVSAGSALWSLRSNVRQHSFVQRAVFTWLADAPDSAEAQLYRMQT